MNMLRNISQRRFLRMTIYKQNHKLLPRLYLDIKRHIVDFVHII